jgi:LysM domain-containing protein
MRQTRQTWSLAALLVLAASGARAQEGAPSDANNDSPPSGSAGDAVEVEPPTTTTNTQYLPAFLPPPGTNLDRYLPSSSQSKGDIYQKDGFDIGRPLQNSATLRGNADSLGVVSMDEAGAVSGKEFHVVRRGDTLWEICNAELKNPWLWPRVWSYNPHLQNPHWIYPGDQLRLVPPGSVALASHALGDQAGGGSGRFVNRRPLVPPDTVFLRDVGYIDDPDKEVWGQVIGARKEQQFLTESNIVYMILRPGAELKLGQLMTVFIEAREPESVDGARMPPGSLVAFKGTVQIDQWNPETRIARGNLIESLDIIERGAKIGPVGRRFYVVPPEVSDVDVEGRVLTSLYPHVLLGKDQVVFIDRGANDGLRAGNRLFVVRRGDAWRQTLLTTTHMASDQIRLDVPEHMAVEATPMEGDEEDFPEEIIGEVRIVRAHPYASLAVVSQSAQEIEPGDKIVSKKGF